MSFRSRLSLFFTIIVIVPMAAVALVLFSLTADSETGKADARLAEGLRVALAVYRNERAQAEPALSRVATDRRLGRALATGRSERAAERIKELRAADPRVVAIVLHDADGREVARTGSEQAVAPATAAPTDEDGERVGTLAVSVTDAPDLVREIASFTGLEARLLRGDVRLASTIAERGRAAADSGSVKISGRDYRGRFQRIDQPAGPSVQLGVFEEADELSQTVTRNRLLIGGILLAFLTLSLASSIFVVRALQGQVDQFLQAARRLGRGDFSRPVPIQGSDEFAALGAEFNMMSEQLAAKIDEVERKRRELEEAIRRVGDAFAAGLDRAGIVDLTVQTAVEACSAEAGRMEPFEERELKRSRAGSGAAELTAALEDAEREAFKLEEEEIKAAEGDGDRVPQRQFARAERGGVHAVAAPLRARFRRGDSRYLGVLSIARRNGAFTDSECELLAYLAGQAAVSLENASLHQTVQRQAITDELTGLYNLRHFHDALDTEIERSRRFSSPVGLVMLDIDDFKPVNDTYGHLQGDLVLREVAHVLHEHSREIDAPARYGGEEMAAILPETDVGGAEQLAERMRAAIEGLRVRRLDGQGELRVTASFGVAALPRSASDKESLIKAADEALYEAKRGGKNRVERAAAAPAAR